MPTTINGTTGASLAALSTALVPGGTLGQVLTSQGASPPTWASVSAGLGSSSQSWQNVITTPGRAFGVTYTNSTGNPIMLAVGGTSVATGGQLAISVNAGSAFAFGFFYNSGGGTYGFAGTIIIPTGATYNVSQTGNPNAASLGSWWELR